MKAVLLAAGFATRLHPLTLNKAKPLLDVGGRPIATHIVERLAGIDDLTEVVVVTNARFHADFQEWATRQPLSVPFTVIDDGTTDNENRLGAIADMALALDHAGGDESFLVCAGDNLVAFELSAFTRAHEAHDRAPLLAVRPAPAQVPPRRYGEVELTPDGRVQRFREKPADPRSPWLSTGLYVYPPRIRTRLEEYLTTGGNPDAPGYFLEWLVTREATYTLPIPGPWFDIGSHESLATARAAFE